MDSMRDPDDSILSLNGMHGKLSKKYLDKFPEDRSTEDAGLLPAGAVFSPGGKSKESHLHSTFLTKTVSAQAGGVHSTVGGENVL